MYLIKIITASGKIYYQGELDGECIGLTNDINQAKKYPTITAADMDLDCAFLQAQQGELLEWDDEQENYQYAVFFVKAGV